MKENWKPIEGYEGLYEVSDFGRVKSVDHETPVNDVLGRAYTKRIKGRMRKTSKCPSGYLQVTLTRPEGTREVALVHRLVASAFVVNPEALPEVNHKDGNKTNNSATNLEWCTRIENVHHAFNVLGKSGAHPKLSETQVRFIRSSRDSARSIAKRFGVSGSTVENARNGKTYKGVI